MKRQTPGHSARSYPRPQKKPTLTNVSGKKPPRDPKRVRTTPKGGSGPGRERKGPDNGSRGRVFQPCRARCSHSGKKDSKSRFKRAARWCLDEKGGVLYPPKKEAADCKSSEQCPLKGAKKKAPGDRKPKRSEKPGKANKHRAPTAGALGEGGYITGTSIGCRGVTSE